MSDLLAEESNSDHNDLYKNPITLIQHLMSSSHPEQQEIKILGERAIKFREHACKLRERLLNDEKQIDTLIRRLKQVKQSIKELNSSIEHSKTIKKEYLKNLESIESSEKSLFSNEYENSTLQQMYQLTKQFERSFGLCIERTHSNLIQLLFYGCNKSFSISPSSSSSNTMKDSNNYDNNIVCCCQLKLTDTKRLEIVNCDPPISDLDRLVNHLNWTEDFRSFIILLRQRFCRYFELAKIVSNKLNVK